MGEYLNATDTYLRLALKAQAQCRATLQTLAEIKNPRPVAFVKQANIAHGPATGEQRDAGGRGKCGKSIKRTIGSEQWRTAGRRNGGCGTRRLRYKM